MTEPAITPELVGKHGFTQDEYAHADQVGGLTVFNIGGNKARLIATIHYNRRKVYIRAVLTHPEYDAGKWKKK